VLNEDESERAASEDKQKRTRYKKQAVAEAFHADVILLKSDSRPSIV
jgi:hypothetical protein